MQRLFAAITAKLLQQLAATKSETIVARRLSVAAAVARSDAEPPAAAVIADAAI